MNVAKAVLRGNFIAINVYNKKEERSQIYNITRYLKEIEKEKQTKPQLSRRKDITHIRVEINQTE